MTGPIDPLLLDPDRLSSWCHDRGLPDLQRLRYRRVKPGTSAVAGVDLVDGPAFLVAWAEPEPGKIGKYLRRSPDAVLFHDDRTLLARVSADRHLPGLTAHRDLFDGATTLSHKPMRRWVGRRDVAGGSQVVRMYATGTATPTRHLAVAAAVPGVARVRRAPGADVLVLDHLPGAPLRVSDDWRPVGRLLRTWHSTILPTTAPPARRPDWAASAALAAQLLPDRASRLARLLTTVAPEPGGRSLCHGDFSPDQVVLGSDGPALLDLDHAGRGDPAWDLASWFVTAPEPARAGLLDGYGLGPALTDLPPAVLRVLPAVCLGRCTEAFRTCRPDWPAELDRLLALAENALHLQETR